MDVVGTIMDYENGELDYDGTLELFSNLITTGLCWQLQGSYGRQAQYYIDNGIINKDGTIN
jgi:hypothetical protein